MATRKKRPPVSRKKRPVLTSLSSDWYWEQDAQLRFVRIEVHTGTPGEQELAEKTLGRRPWQTGISIEGGWDAHRALLKRRAPFREVLMWRDFDDGSRRFISASGEPVFDPKGGFTGYRGIGRDITRQKRGEQLLRLQHTVTRTLAEAPDAVRGTEEALRAVCETEGWDVGQFWRLDPAARVMRRFAHYVMPGVAPAQRFADASRDVEFVEGVGLVGAAWQSAQPLWIPDSTQDARAQRKVLAQETGMRGTLLCPIQLEGSVVGMLNFDCCKIRPPDEALLQALTAIGTQLGLYLRRADTEAALRESEGRFRRTFELAGSGVAHLSLDRRFLRVNRKLCDILGYPERELIDRSVLEVSHSDDVDRTSAQRERLYAGEIDSLSMEKRYVHKDGRVVWAGLTLALERDADGKPQYEIAVYDDITARKAAEEAMRESEERFRRTFELAGSGVAHVGMDGALLRVNRRLCEMFACAESELVGRSVKALSHPDDRDLTDTERARLHRGEIQVARFEKRYLRTDGSTLWVNMSVALERDAAGTPLYEISVLDDIGARKAAETALRDSEARFRSLTELSSDWFWEQDAEYRFTRLEGRNVGGGNDKMREEVIGTRCWDRPLEVEGGWDAYRGLLEARSAFHDLLMWRRIPDGTTRYVRISGEPVFDGDGRFAGYRGVGRDVTAQKHAEESLRDSEARFRNTFELAGVGVAHIGLDRRFQRVNRRFCEILGYPESELIGRTGRDLSHPDDLDAMNVQRPSLYAGEIEAVRGEKRYLRKDGSVVWVAYTLAIERDAAGNPQYEIAVYDDISARKAAEAALRDSEARFRSLTELSSDWFWEQDAEYRFTRLEGRSVAGGDLGLRERLIGARRWESGLEVDGGWDAHRALLDARKPFHDVGMWRRMSGGHMRYVSVSGEPIFAADGRFAGYRGVGRDVTLEKRAAQLLRLEHQVAKALSEATDLASGITAVLRLVCEAEGWGCGRSFRVDEAGRLIYRRGWTAAGSPFEKFLESSRDLAFARGRGLVGIAWQTGEPLWSTDTSRDPRVMAKSLAVEEARGAFVFPVKVEGQTIGVLSFTSQEVREPDERLLQASRVISSQVGQFLRRMRAEENMRRFRLGVDSSADMMLLIDVDTMRFIDVNSTACNLLGYSREELLAMGPQDVLPVSREELAGSYEALIAAPSTLGSMNSYYRCKDGSLIPFESTRRVLQSAGRPIIVAISRDIRERIAAEEALRESEARFRALTEMSSDFFWETDAQHRLTDMVYGQSFNGKMDGAVGQAAWDLPSTHPDAAGWAELRAKVDRHQPFRDFEFGRPRVDGGVRYFSVSGEPRLAADGRFLGYRGVGRDITDLMLARERIASLAYQDPLTGLANRTSLGPALEQALERTRRRGNKLAGVFLDLDGFKQINDLHGHDAGDRLLVELAQRLRAALRSSDPVARLGGDEFFVLLEDLQSHAPAERVAQKLLAAVELPYDIGAGQQVGISASIGISVFPDDAGDAPTLIKHADTAMYNAKQAGKNAYRFFASGPAANDGRTAGEEEKIL